MMKIFKRIVCLFLALLFAVFPLSQSFAFSAEENNLFKSNYTDRLANEMVEAHNVHNYTINNATKIENYGWIDSLVNSDMFGNNIYGTCGAVAGTVLLRYYQHLVGDFLIPKNYATATTKYNWSIENNTYYYTMSNGVIEESILWQLDSTVTIYENTHRYLYYLMEESYGTNNPYSDVFGVSELNVYGGMDAYISEIECIENLHFGLYSCNDNDKNILFTQLINSDIPFISFIYKNGEGHIAVIYGYVYNAQEQKYYYLIHTGWNDFVFLIIPEDYFLSEVFFCDVDINDITYSHNETCELIDSESHKVHCTNCDLEIVEDHQKQYTIINSTTHHASCSQCSYSANENHNLVYDGSNSSNHVITCSDCGWSTTQAHQFTYSGISPQLHRKKCSICNRTTTETHIFKGGKCRLCQYTQGGNDEILEDGGVMD